MPSIDMGDQLIPPSLLPVLHDCVHHRPPLWFAELEELYRNVDNLPSLSRSLDPAYVDLQKRELRAGVVQRVKKHVFGPRAEAKRSYSTPRYTETDYLLGQRYYRWMMLADARAAYVAHAVSGTDGSASDRLAAMGKLEDATDKALEAAMADLPVLGLTAAQLAHLATLDVYLPPSSANKQPSSRLPLRPSSVSHCWLFHTTLSSACRAGMSLTEAHEHLGERVGGGDEAEWECAAYAILEKSRQERLMQLEEYK